MHTVLSEYSTEMVQTRVLIQALTCMSLRAIHLTMPTLSFQILTLRITLFILPSLFDHGTMK